MISEESYENYRVRQQLADASEIGKLREQLADANAKIAELQQAATTLRQLEELLHTHSLVSFEKIVGNYQTVLPNTGWAWVRKDLPAAIAAAWERRVE